jgi:beta-aspartyl-peptidase (threonine type)
MISGRAVLLVHGGAGAIPELEKTPERASLYRDDVERALRAGFAVLDRPGGSSLDAVEEAIRVLEDSPLFNAGRGSVFNREGRNELDASIMEGRERKAGAVACVTRVKNPISAARQVMDASGHVLLVGQGADAFADERGLEMVEPGYFWTERRWKSYLDALASERRPERDRFGTVGAVALDGDGNLAAGASTGGMTVKRPGRVGDSPVIGAGVYAENGVCAVSCTGHGEAFIRLAIAHEVIALMKYASLTVEEATRRVVRETLRQVGGEGGLIALAADGSFAMPFNTRAMVRGSIDRDGRTFVAIDEV